jgi:hypothetical protein
VHAPPLAEADAGDHTANVPAVVVVPETVSALELIALPVTGCHALPR